jgi:enolase-phosphatase E1
MSKPRVYLLDVEGTVAPLSLVYEKMFPYVRRNLGAFLKAHADELKEELALLIEENRVECDAPGFDGTRIEAATDIAAAEKYLLWLMDCDRKSTALKNLQGKIWRVGFENGELAGELFDDVAPAIARWAKRAQVAIYSSGSVEAQQLFFRYSSAGDLTPLIAANFDTRTGAKGEASSYTRIAHEMGAQPIEIRFYSDVVRELDAAREAGCETRLVVRHGNAPIADANVHKVILSFEEE